MKIGQYMLYLVVGIAGVAITWQSLRLAEAQAGRRHATRALKSAGSQAAELTTLRGQAQTRMFGPPPEAAIVAAVNRASEDAGLAPSIATSISRQEERPSQDGKARIQDVRIELGPLSVPELGGFLAAWRINQPAWRTTSINLRRPTGRQHPPGTYQITLVCSAEYAPEGT